MAGRTNLGTLFGSGGGGAVVGGLVGGGAVVDGATFAGAGWTAKSGWLP